MVRLVNLIKNENLLLLVSMKMADCLVVSVSKWGADTLSAVSLSQTSRITFLNEGLRNFTFTYIPNCGPESIYSATA